MSRGKRRRRNQPFMGKGVSNMDNPKVSPIGKKMGQPGQKKQVEIDLSDANRITCKCGCVVFQQGVMIFKVSAIMSPTGQELMINKGVVSCIKCHEPVDDKSLVAGVTPVTVG